MGSRIRHQWQRLLLSGAATIVIAAFLSYWLFDSPDAPPPSALVPLSGSAETTLNPCILAELEEYQHLPPLPVSMVSTSMGTTQDLYYKGTRVISGDPEHRSYCCGLMLELYMKSCERWASEAHGGKNYALRNVASFRDFRRDWYGVDGNEKTMVHALVSRGLGREINDPGDARPGDLIQFWRNSGSGHSVIFLEWETSSKGLRTALKYWSVQHMTGGIAENTESLLPGDANINPNRIYIARPFVPGDSR